MHSGIVHCQAAWHKPDVCTPPKRAAVLIPSSQQNRDRDL
jgi:hypothetical protein